MSTASQSLLFVERVCQTQPGISNGLLGIGIHTNQLNFFPLFVVVFRDKEEAS